MESNSELLQPREKIESLPQWDSAYKPVALKTLEKVTRQEIRRRNPETTKEVVEQEVLRKREKLKAYLDAIDNKVANNFGIFESKENPDVRFPYTRVSINEIASTVKPDQKTTETQMPKKIWVVFTPFTLPPGGGPDDTMNVIYDRVLTSLSELVEKEGSLGKDIEVYGLGLPTSKWGSVSKEWLDDFKEHGFSKYGELYAEFLRTVFGKDFIASEEQSEELQQKQHKRNIMFFGGSMGTILASETAKQLPEYWSNLRVLLDNPTGIHKPSNLPLSVKGTQVAMGFSAEVGIRMLTDGIVRSALSGAKSARENLNVVLQKRGIVSYESDEQNRLKRDTFLQEIKSLVKGTPLDTENFRSYVVQGMLDPATTDFKRILFLISHGKGQRFFKAGNRSLGMGVNYSHWLDRGRWPQRWIRGIERYER